MCAKHVHVKGYLTKKDETGDTHLNLTSSKGATSPRVICSDTWPVLCLTYWDTPSFTHSKRRTNQTDTRDIYVWKLAGCNPKLRILSNLDLLAKFYITWKTVVGNTTLTIFISVLPEDQEEVNCDWSLFLPHREDRRVIDRSDAGRAVNSARLSIHGELWHSDRRRRVPSHLGGSHKLRGLGNSCSSCAHLGPGPLLLPDPHLWSTAIFVCFRLDLKLIKGFCHLASEPGVVPVHNHLFRTISFADRREILLHWTQSLKIQRKQTLKILLLQSQLKGKFPHILIRAFFLRFFWESVLNIYFRPKCLLWMLQMAIFSPFYQESPASEARKTHLTPNKGETFRFGGITFCIWRECAFVWSRFFLFAELKGRLFVVWDDLCVSQGGREVEMFDGCYLRSKVIVNLSPTAIRFGAWQWRRQNLAVAPFSPTESELSIMLWEFRKKIYSSKCAINFQLPVDLVRACSHLATGEKLLSLTPQVLSWMTRSDHERTEN